MPNELQDRKIVFLTADGVERAELEQLRADVVKNRILTPYPAFGPTCATPEQLMSTRRCASTGT